MMKRTQMASPFFRQITQHLISFPKDSDLRSIPRMLKLNIILPSSLPINM